MFEDAVSTLRIGKGRPQWSEQGKSTDFVDRLLDLKAFVVEASKLDAFTDFSHPEKNPIIALIKTYSKKPKNDVGTPAPHGNTSEFHAHFCLSRHPARSISTF